MSAPEVVRLFDQWERVWHEGQYDLVPVQLARPGGEGHGAARPPRPLQGGERSLIEAHERDQPITKN
jgi:hypothetical protein